MTKLTYIGPYDSVDVYPPSTGKNSGVAITVKNGDSFSTGAAHASALLLQESNFVAASGKDAGEDEPTEDEPTEDAEVVETEAAEAESTESSEDTPTNDNKELN